MNQFPAQMKPIRNWPQFARRVRPGGTPLLAALPNYERSIFVAGCQRSGGTMLANAFTEHTATTDFTWSKDAELDAAQILAGVRSPANASTPHPRYCFQTTYLNERYTEYFDHVGRFHLIWLVRNPYSVVYSMLYNWKRFALNEVYNSCGAALATDTLSKRQQRFGIWGVKPVYRACYAYLGKINQGIELVERLPADVIATVGYDDLVTHRETMLSQLFRFTDLPDTAVAGDKISTKSLTKANALNSSERAIVKDLCEDAYEGFIAKHLSVRP